MAELYLAGREIASGEGHRAGRELLAALYRQNAGGECPPIALGERGKPCFTEGGWHFSITHTKKHAFCALAKHPVGIDAEELDRKIDLRLAEKLLSPGEKAQFDAAEDKRLALLTFWVLKEATAKLTGEGLNGYPNKTDFRLDDLRVQRKDGCLLAVLQSL